MPRVVRLRVSVNSAATAPLSTTAFDLQVLTIAPDSHASTSPPAQAAIPQAPPVADTVAGTGRADTVGDAAVGVAKRDATQIARERPAVLLCFDVLTLAGHDLTMSPLVERRRHLEDLVGGLHPCLQLVTQTHDRQLAEQWLTMLSCVEGVVAKRGDGRYSAGRQHAWIKVKRQRTVDCVVIGVAGDNASLRLVLGLRHGDQELRHLGRLGGVICHFDWTRNMRFEPCQRLLRYNCAKKQGGVLGDEPVPVRAALRKCSFEARFASFRSESLQRRAVV